MPAPQFSERELYSAITTDPLLNKLQAVQGVMGYGLGVNPDDTYVIRVMVEGEQQKLLVKRLLGNRDDFDVHVPGHGKVSLPLDYEVCGPLQGPRQPGI